MIRRWHCVIVGGIDDVVKAQRHAMMLLESLKRIQFGKVWIDQRQNMGDLSRSLPGQFLNPAHRQLRGKLHAHASLLEFHLCRLP